MSHASLRALPLSLACAAAAAQVPPAIVDTAPGNNSRPPDASSFVASRFVINAVPATSVQQLELQGIPGQPGLWRVAATVTGLSQFFTSGGQQDLIEAIWNESADTITVLVDANNRPTTNSLVTAGADFALTISNDGLRTACDTPAGCMWASRTTAPTTSPVNPSDMFGPPAPIVGLPAGVGPYCDSKFMYEGGVEKFAYIDGSGNIGAGDFNNGVVTNNGQRIARIGATSCHSHAPMTDTNGDLLGWIVSAINGNGGSDSYFVPGLDDTLDAPQQIYNDGGWQANPSPLGASGSTVWAHANPGYGTPLELNVVATNGQQFPAAQNSVLCLRVWVPKRPTPWAVALAIAPLPFGPLDVPGTLGNRLATSSAGARPPGQVGILALPLVVLQGVSAPNVGGFTFKIPVAAGTFDPPGTSLKIQAIGIDLAGNQLYLGNTATVRGN